MRIKSRWNTVLFNILLLSALFVFTGCSTENKEDLVSVTLLNIGKADCILIRSDGQTMMIDTGFDESSEKIFEALDAEKIDHLDYLLLSHPDKDHIGGADKVIKKIPIGTVFQTTIIAHTKAYEEYEKTLEEMKIEPETVSAIRQLSMGKAKIIIYPPMKGDYEGTNDYSLAVKLIYGETDFLFTGDAERERMEELLVQIPDIQSDFLKVPHHGREEDSGFFLKMVRPQIAVITNENNWKVGEQVIQSIAEYGGKVYFTGDGIVTVTSNGKELEIKQNQL